MPIFLTVKVTLNFENNEMKSIFFNFYQNNKYYLIQKYFYFSFH